MNGKRVVVILAGILAMMLGLSSCTGIYPPQQPATTPIPNPQTTPTPGPASSPPAQPEQSGPASLGMTYEVIHQKDPSWSLDRSKVIEYETGELEKGVTVRIPPGDLRIIPVTSTKDRRIGNWGFNVYGAGLKTPNKGEPENYIDFWAVNEWGGKEDEGGRFFNEGTIWTAGGNSGGLYEGSFYLYLSNQFDSTSAKDVVLQVNWVTPPPPTPPAPPPQPVSHSIPQHQPLTIEMLANFQRPEDIHLFPIYLKNSQRLHFTFSVIQGQPGFFFAIPGGKNIRLNASGKLVETNLHDGEFIQLGNVIFKPSDYGWGEGYYEMTFGISDIGQNYIENGENKAQVEVEYWIED